MQQQNATTPATWATPKRDADPAPASPTAPLWPLLMRAAREERARMEAEGSAA